MQGFQEPWSKRHKRVTKGTPYSLSNSFAEPLTMSELLQITRDRGDDDLIREYNCHSLEYTANGGSLDLREQIASLYGADIGAANILVFAGAQVALQTAAVALMQPESHAIVFQPGYQSVQNAPLHAGFDVTTLYLEADRGWSIDVEAVEAAIRPETRYIVVNEPFNPTGSLSSAKTQQQLIALGEKHQVYILSDEVYRFLEHREEDRIPAMAEVYSRGLSASTVSKAWGGCGISIGWLAVRDLSLMQRLVDVQYFGTQCPSRASEIQAIMALRASDKILARNLKIIRHNMTLLDSFLETYSDFFKWVRPRAGAIGFVKFKGPMTSDQLGGDLASAGISVKPAYVFLGEEDIPARFAGYFRVGFGESKMPAALQALTTFVEEHRAKWQLSV